MNTIYVQIASYRDPELLPTIRDCIKKADNPNNLKFGIAWQHSKRDTWDNLDAYRGNPKFNIFDIDYEDSLGTCWARHVLNEAYMSETYTLQLDSHHRFVKGWDTKCIKMMENLNEAGYKKPLLTAYVPSYNPHNDPQERVKEVWKLNFDRFTPEGVIFMLPAHMDYAERHVLPVPTRFLSAHFLFTYGSFISEVPYDPNLYFHGEEISMAVRAYTSGYDLFVPNEIIAWHEYTRQGRIRHWDENSTWESMNKKSLKRVKCLLGVDGDKQEEPFGKYGLGKERKIEDYERYAGIRFKDRAVQQYTLDNFDPPNPTYTNEVAYEKSFKSIFRHCLDIYRANITETDYEFWAVVFEDDEGNELYREDAHEEEIQTLLSESTGDWVNLWRQYEDSKVPAKAVVWPYSRAQGWGDRIEITIPRL